MLYLPLETGILLTDDAIRINSSIGATHPNDTRKADETTFEIVQRPFQQKSSSTFYVLKKPHFTALKLVKKINASIFIVP